MDTPRIPVDFNEMVEPDLVLLSQTDVRVDSAGTEIQLAPGVRVHIYETSDDDELRVKARVFRRPDGTWEARSDWKFESIGE